MSSREYRKKDPLYGAAILKVSLELKGRDLASYQGIVRDTCRQLGIREQDVERYIRKNRAMLEEVCRKEGLV